MKTAIYIRVSTQEQVDEGYSIEAQADRLQAYCKAKEWVVTGVYKDAGFSGSNTERPALQRLLNDVRAGLVDCVLVYKLDRLSRSQKDTLMLIEDEFLARDVAFVSMSENFDTSTPLGRAMVGILSVFAQLEREQIKERMAMGRAERAKNGYFHGGGRPPFGYTYSTEDSLLHTEPIEAEIVRDIYRLFLQRKPITTIFNQLSRQYGRIITHSVVESVLTTPIYKGYISWEGNLYPGKHEALVDEETYERAQALLADRRRIAESKPLPFQPKHLLGSFLECGNCGAGYTSKGNYSGHGDKKKYRPYYTCYSRAKTNKSLVKDPSCINPSYACADLDQHIIDEITRMATNEKAFLSAVAAKNKKRHSPDSISERKKAAIQKRIDTLDTQIRRILDLYQLGNIDIGEIKKRVTTLESERNALLLSLKEKSKSDSYRYSPEAARSLLHDFAEVSKTGDIRAMRAVLKELIQKIIVLPTKGEFEIIWNF